MKTEPITTALSKLTEQGAKTRLAESLNISLSQLQEKARRGHKLAYIGDKVLTNSKAEEAALKKFGFIDNL